MKKAECAYRCICVGSRVTCSSLLSANSVANFNLLLCKLHRNTESGVFLKNFLWLFLLFQTGPANEYFWQQNNSKSLMSQFSGMSNNQSLGSYLMSSEFSAPAQDGSHLLHFQTEGLQAELFSGKKRSSTGKQQDPGASTSIQAFLSYSGNSSQSVEEKSPDFVANACCSSKTVKSSEDSSFLQHSFLALATGHNGQNSTDQQNQGTIVHHQPPLPEKKRTSEGDHSSNSVSPSPSVFSSPHSGSNISIPFPNVLPDFSNIVNTSPLPGMLHP